MDDVLDRRRAMCLQQIIETGTVRGAAEMLNIDASVVSRAVAKLEQDVGVTLLERRGRGVVPTDAGRLVALFARRQADLNDTFLAEINNLKNAERGHVDLVLGEGFVDVVLEPVLQGFLRKHPDITYNIQIAGTDETVRRIVEDAAHIGFVFEPPNDVRLRSHYSRLAPIRVHVRKGHPLTRIRGALRLSHLAKYPAAALTDSFGVRKHIRAAEIEEHVSLKHVLVTNAFKVLWEFAAIGQGYIMTPRSVPLEGARFRQLATLPLANPILNNSHTHVVTRAGRHLSPLANNLLRHIVRTFPQI